MFGTLNYAKKLESVGVSREQAETHVQIIAQIVEDSLATKQDLKDTQSALKQDLVDTRTALKQDFKDLRTEVAQDIRDVRDEMQKLEYRLTIKLGVMMTVATPVLLAILKTHA